MVSPNATICNTIPQAEIAVGTSLIVKVMIRHGPQASIETLSNFSQFMHFLGCANKF